MIGRTGSGWQTTTADLALILFLVVAASAADGGSARETEAAAEAVQLEDSPPAAIYRANAAASLPQWLASQAPDERQIATVLVRRVTSGPSPVLDQGLAFLAQIEASGRTGRLLIERGSIDEVAVVLAYDRAPESGTPLAAR